MGLSVLQAMTRGTTVLTETRATAAKRREDEASTLTLLSAAGVVTEVHARWMLDATDLGELWPLLGIPFRTGTEARSVTGEEHAPEAADPGATQSFTFPFVVEWRPGERHVIEKPTGYERFRDTQPFTLTLTDTSGGRREFGFRTRRTGTPGSFFDYRRIGPDLAMINWPGNDYRGTSILAPDLDEAKRLSLSFLYWLQTECPRDDGGSGYPELRLRPDVLGTLDGPSKRPYVREGRRLIGLHTVLETDLVTKLARATLVTDSVGLGWYPIDLHVVAGAQHDRHDPGLPTRPFQIPLASLIPPDTRNVLAAGKSLSVSHVANGAYRVHPVEWAIGEAAARVVLFCHRRSLTPRGVLEDGVALRDLQRTLLAAGVPLFWFPDWPLERPLAAEAHALAVWGRLPFDPERLELGSGDALSNDLRRLSETLAAEDRRPR